MIFARCSRIRAAPLRPFDGEARDDLRQRPAVDQEVGHQQQLRVGEQRFLLLGRELREEFAALVHELDEVADLEPDLVADLLEPLERERLAREQPLDARFAQPDARGELGVGHALRLQVALELAD